MATPDRTQEREIRNAYHQLNQARLALGDAAAHLLALGMEQTADELAGLVFRTVNAMTDLENYTRGMGWEL